MLAKQDSQKLLCRQLFSFALWKNIFALFSLWENTLAKQYPLSLLHKQLLFLAYQEICASKPGFIGNAVKQIFTSCYLVGKMCLQSSAELETSTFAY